MCDDNQEIHRLHFSLAVVPSGSRQKNLNMDVYP